MTQADVVNRLVDKLRVQGRPGGSALGREVARKLILRALSSPLIEEQVLDLAGRYLREEPCND